MVRTFGFAMGEKEGQELKLTDISFSASFKFWLAYLIVQIIATFIAVGIIVAIFSWITSISRIIMPPAHLALHQLLREF
jgi:ABC-type multidrug transport system permease subunit